MHHEVVSRIVKLIELAILFCFLYRAYSAGCS